MQMILTSRILTCASLPVQFRTVAGVLRSGFVTGSNILVFNAFEIYSEGVLKSKSRLVEEVLFVAQGEAPGVPPTNGSEGHRSTHVPEETIREELARVLSSHEFRASKRSQDFLRYAVENTLNGHTDRSEEH